VHVSGDPYFGKPLQAFLDTGADTIYIAKELADEIGLSYMIPIHGVAQGTPSKSASGKVKSI